MLDHSIPWAWLDGGGVSRAHDLGRQPTAQALGPGAAIRTLILPIAILLSGLVSPAAAAPQTALLSGKISEVARADAVWIGALEIQLRGARLFEDQQSEALTFMRALATHREVECELTGERLGGPSGTLVGRCLIFGPTDGREIDLAERLIERGFARPCGEPAAVIAIWPPVYACP